MPPPPPLLAAMTDIYIKGRKGGRGGREEWQKRKGRCEGSPRCLWSSTRVTVVPLLGYNVTEKVKIIFDVNGPNPSLLYSTYNNRQVGRIVKR